MLPDGVLVTRPEPGATATARAVRALGLRPFCVPFLAIAPRSAELPGDAQAVLVTSGNALAAPHPSLHGIRLFAVGDATAARAREAGFAQVESARADARALAALVAARCDPAGAPLLLLSGEGQGRPLAEDLRGRGFSVLHRAVYASLPVTTFPAPADQAIRT